MTVTRLLSGLLLWNCLAVAVVAESAFIGLWLDPTLPPGRGQPIAEVSFGGPAEAAGLRPGDTLLSVDGLPIRAAQDVERALEGSRPGDQIRVEAARAGQKLQLVVRLGERPDEPPADPEFQPEREPQQPPSADGYLGVATIAPTDRDLQRLQVPARFTRGALVLSTSPNSVAARLGIRRSDLIVAVDGQAVDTPAELNRRLVQTGAGNKAIVMFVRDGRTREVNATLMDPQRPPPAPIERPAPPAPGAGDWTVERRLDSLERQVRLLDERTIRMQETLDQILTRLNARPLPQRSIPQRPLPQRSVAPQVPPQSRTPRPLPLRSP